MKVDNPLSREFLLHYPAEAARVMEQVSAEHVAALLTELPVQTAVPVMASMLAEKAAACQLAMPMMSAAKLMGELPVSSAVRIYRLFPPVKQVELSAHLSDKIRRKIQRYLTYPAASAGALLESEIDILPEAMTVAEAIRYLENLGHSISCDIYIIDNAYHLVGLIDLGRLITSSHRARLRDIMSRKTQPIVAHATAASLLSHPGWMTRRRLPVVERDNTLLGALDYSTLQDSLSEMDTVISRDPLENLLSLAGLYWISLAQLLDSVLSIVSSDKGKRS